MNGVCTHLSLHTMVCALFRKVRICISLLYKQNTWKYGVENLINTSLGPTVGRLSARLLLLESL